MFHSIDYLLLKLAGSTKYTILNSEYKKKKAHPLQVIIKASITATFTKLQGKKQTRNHL